MNDESKPREPLRPHLFRRLDPRKCSLVAVLALSSVLPILLVRLDEPTVHLNVVKALAKIGSVAGTILIAWQWLLGVREISRRLHPDRFWLTSLHKILGQVGLPLILFHPVFITVYYLMRYEVNIWNLNMADRRDPYVVLGIIAFAILVLLLVTSAVARTSLSYRAWYRLHATSYLVLPIVLIHSIPIGETLARTRLMIIWQTLALLTLAVIVLRLLSRAGMLAKLFEATRVESQVSDTVTIYLRPRDKPIRPRNGQFVYARQGRWGSTHPYTVSHFDKASGTLGITVKDLGRESGRWQHTRPGQEFRLDGPYGVFGRSVETHHLPVVMIAGGIGITAFRRLIHDLEDNRDRPAWLFYGNTVPEDVVFGHELDHLEHVRVVHVMSEADEYPGETGFVTPELLEKYLGSDLPGHDFLICGPPIMTQKLEPALRERGVPTEQLQHELYSA